jgi:hypothetical protein
VLFAIFPSLYAYVVKTRHCGACCSGVTDELAVLDNKLKGNTHPLHARRQRTAKGSWVSEQVEMFARDATNDKLKRLLLELEKRFAER